MGARLAQASVQTFTRELATQPEGQCVLEWTAPDGRGMQTDVFNWQRIDGFQPGDMIDVTTQAKQGRTLSVPVKSSRRRVEITLDPDDVVVVRVGDDGWEYGAIIKGARTVMS
jgi:hypothetical protein